VSTMAGPLRILLLDDKADDRPLVMHQLQGEFPDLQVEQIAAAQGLAPALETGQFNLVITASQVLGTDGLAVLRGLKARWPNCPLIMLTGNDSEGLALQAMQAGLDDYVLKSPKHCARLPVAVRLALERSRERQALQEAETHLENQEHLIGRILDSIPSSLLVIDRALQVVSVNRNFLEKGRRELQATLGHRIEEVFPPVLARQAQLEQKAREVFRSGQPAEGGKVAYRAPGLATRIYYYRLIPLKAEEVVENVLLLMDDITEREELGQEIRRAERHLASVVECANDLVISLDPQGRIVTWNRAAEVTSGIKAEEVKGRPLLALSAAEQRPLMVEMLRGLACGEGVQHTQVNLVTVSGQEVPIAWNCSPMRDDAGAVVGVVAVGRDLTEQQRLEAQLIHSAKMASLGVMAGGIAHELRNPLGIISAGAQLLLEYPDDTHLRSECAQKIHAATQRASLIIENLLKFAHPQGSQMKEVDLHAVLEETLPLLAHQMALRKVTLRKEFQPDLPKVSGNPELLQQVLTNLILNACNAMPEGGMLTVATRANRAGQVEVRVRDTGCGIPEEHLPKIFDPFFSTMPVGKGTGLGLSISYSIMQQHQGTIEVESQVGRGSTFIVRLPAMPDSRAVG
jgi:PAS domain S-box-containing protein